MKFELYGIPISVNQSLIAMNNRLISSAKARTYHKDAELALQNQLDQQIRVCPSVEDELHAMEGQPLFCQIQIYSNWVTKAGKIRKSDLANREKACADSLFKVLSSNGYDLDDSQIYMMVLIKQALQESEEDKTLITLCSLSDFNKQRESDLD